MGRVIKRGVPSCRAVGVRARLPSSAEEGWPRHQKENGAATFDGADGVVLVKRYVRFPDQHHPVCAAVDASQLLSPRAATPPRLPELSKLRMRNSCKRRPVRYAREFPSSAEEGWPRHQKENGAATSDGADGVVLVRSTKQLLTNTTPSARLRMLRNFLTSRSHPSSAEEGSRAHPNVLLIWTAVSAEEGGSAKLC